MQPYVRRKNGHGYHLWTLRQRIETCGARNVRSPCSQVCARVIAVGHSLHHLVLGPLVLGPGAELLVRELGQLGVQRLLRGVVGSGNMGGSHAGVVTAGAAVLYSVHTWTAIMAACVTEDAGATQYSTSASTQWLKTQNKEHQVQCLRAVGHVPNWSERQRTVPCPALSFITAACSSCSSTVSSLPCRCGWCQCTGK